jgi:hypothetical protein
MHESNIIVENHAGVYRPTHLLGKSAIAACSVVHGTIWVGVVFQSRSRTSVLFLFMIPIPPRTHPIAHAQGGVGARHFEFPR